MFEETEHGRQTEIKAVKEDDKKGGKNKTFEGK